MEALDKIIEQVPKGCKAIYFLLPISWKDKIKESDYKGYVFNYSVYCTEDYALLSEKEYKDEMLFKQTNP